jgi:hypothetical protein
MSSIFDFARQVIRTSATAQPRPNAAAPRPVAVNRPTAAPPSSCCSRRGR